VKRRVLRVCVGAVNGADLEAPWQRCRAAEELLVEVVADPADGLRDEQAGGGGVQEGRDVGTAAAQHDQAGERAAGDAAPDAKAAFPDRQRPPPVVGHLVPTGGQVVDPPADQARRKAPQRDLVDELTPAALALPAAPGQRDRRQQGEGVHHPIGVDEQRPDVQAVDRWAGNGREHGAQCPSPTRGSRRRLSATALSATITLEPAIEMAPTSGRSTNPSGSKTPAAIGSASEL
jgi:hypothetical protein